MNKKLSALDALTNFSTGFYNGLNQLTLKQGGSPATTVNYSYDANGNQTTEKTGNNAVVSFAYDTDNQLTSVKKQTKVINTNVYNSEGQRIAKTDGQGQATNYFYQGSVALYTTNATGAKTTFNLFGGSDNTIATKRYQGNYKDKYLSYNKDIRTSTSTLLADSGTYTLSYDYSDFGETKRAGDSTITNEIAYTGGIYDADTELYYLNARYYDPGDARFMTQDTYRGENTDPETLNLYGYCAGNPINYVDPSGHKSIKSIYYLGKYAKGNNYKNNLMKQALHSGYYKRSQAELGPIRTRKGFKKEWNKIKSNIKEVFIYVHSDARALHFMGGKMTTRDLCKLPKNG
jgi:RHS repeat-associated protein